MEELYLPYGDLEIRRGNKSSFWPRDPPDRYRVKFDMADVPSLAEGTAIDLNGATLFVAAKQGPRKREASAALRCVTHFAETRTLFAGHQASILSSPGAVTEVGAMRRGCGPRLRAVRTLTLSSR